MGDGIENLKEVEIECSWIPQTPLKPDLPKPYQIRGIQRQQEQAKWLGLDGCSSNFTQDDNLGACSEGSSWNFRAASGSTICSEGDGITACKIYTIEEVTQWKSVNGYSFQGLLALQHAPPASGMPTNAGTHKLNASYNHSIEPQNYAAQGCGYDLNFPPESTADATNNKCTYQFAPVTPDKTINNHTGNDQANKIAITGAITNQLQSDKDIQNLATDSSITGISILSENQNLRKGGDATVLERTPQQKPRRKKHRPKVITEGKPRAPKTTVTPKPDAGKESPTGKRKYVRRNVQNKASTPQAEVTAESTDPQVSQPPKKSCRRALNFDTEGQPTIQNSNCKQSSNPVPVDNAGGYHSKSKVNLGNGIEVIVNNTQTGIAHDLNQSVRQILKDYLSQPETPPPRIPMPRSIDPPRRKDASNSQENHAEERDQLLAHTGQENITQITSAPETKMSPNQNGFNYNTNTALITKEQARESKKKHFSLIQPPEEANPAGIHYNTLSQLGFWAKILKRKRTEKSQHSMSSKLSIMLQSQDVLRPETTYIDKMNEDHSEAKSKCTVSASNSDTSKFLHTFGEEGKPLQYHLQTVSHSFGQKERSKGKRSRGRPSRPRKISLLTETETCKFPSGQVAANFKRQQVGKSKATSLNADALAAVIRKKRTKKRADLVNLALSSKSEEQLPGRILYNKNQFLATFSGTMCSVDAIAEQLKHLDINRETLDFTYTQENALVPYGISHEEQNALVLYRRDGTVVPFDGSFAYFKKQRPRPKVDLDEETSRVWKLLLGNINSEGIDGTDEEKIKRWEEERNVFRGRANSFIARMHLVQGDRRFSRWKGSVVDSVIGVFLTQNVSDHLSSSAFMSLAAHFPHKSKSKREPGYEEKAISIINKPIVCIVDPEDTIKSNNTSNQLICDQGSMTLHETEIDDEREAVNSNEFSGCSTGIMSYETGIETCYESTNNISTTEISRAGKMCYKEGKRQNNATSSQISMVSSQNSADTIIIQAAEREESFSENNPEKVERTNGFKLSSFEGSFMELLQKAELTLLNNGNFPYNQNSKNEEDKNMSTDNFLQRQKMENMNGARSSSEASAVPSSDCNVHTANSGVTDNEYVELVTKETRYPPVAKDNGIISLKDHNTFTAESAFQSSDYNRLTISVQEASKSPAHNSSYNNFQDNQMTFQPQTGQVKDPKIVGQQPAQVQGNKMQQSLLVQNLSGETSESNFIENRNSKSKALKDISAATRKAKSRRVGNEIKDNVDWDTLRKQAEANAGKREKTVNTRDSLDYEAVRCADVDEIANTIKERGMNNMLAARIKDFLNRLVRDHGSIDLEWLRDIPPDQAKEYLLSIRGLGLKSVECVRLLTLHHLAFPVDTNVGRIAVRLGWVPLQPLPESLQLHLLELYPVLESIQKYLWPRLCKLDQRTLYELHYQMITFGKVFCTKNKPNCNACPMRGECRHFASAFASARLALPGPEEKDIVSVAQSRTDPGPAATVDPLRLPLPLETQKLKEDQQPEANQLSNIQIRVTNCEPIVEEPSSPEPECRQTTENDIEDMFLEDPDEIPTIKLNIEQFTQNLQNYMQENMELQADDMSKALVALTEEAASIPVPKLKNVSRLRTEHQVYELPDSHPLLQELDRREPDDPCSYLLAIWTPGETADSIQPPQGCCSSQAYGQLCDDETCFSCNSTKEANSQIVRGTLLIPCRTAMRGSFPLNGTYFQVNEVFADHDSSLNPINVPRAWIWNLPRRTVYFGTSVPAIFKGLTTEDIQHCFWRGFVCVRGFDQKTRAPRPLMARLHFPASKLGKNKGKIAEDQ